MMTKCRRLCKGGLLLQLLQLKHWRKQLLRSLLLGVSGNATSVHFFLARARACTATNTNTNLYRYMETHFFFPGSREHYKVTLMLRATIKFSFYF